MTLRANTILYKDEDDLIKRKILYLKSLGDEYWSFKSEYKRDYAHKFFNYPAMMVPQMVRKLLEEFSEIDSSLKHVHDPFVGSGTVLTESIMKGLEFTGRDINPLSILLCKVKSGPFYIKAFNTKIDILLKNIQKDNQDVVELKFRNIDKWFIKDVQISLSKIRRSIIKEESLWARRFFWIALAETVRLVCNSRTTTYKMHIRELSQIKSRNINTFTIFNNILLENFENFKSLHEELKKNKLLNKDIYQKQCKIILGDARNKLYVKNKIDLILTSPPYGDNHTTVTYGQYSYLPLNWIELSDIDRKVTSECIEQITNIDSKSLGGRKVDIQKKEKYLYNKSKTYRNYLKIFEDKPVGLINKITSFFYDFDQTLISMIENVKKGGFLLFVLGNRKVGKVKIELDKVLIELLEDKNIKYLDTIYRPIPNKRMAAKNKSTETMTKESIQIFQKN